MTLDDEPVGEVDVSPESLDGRVLRVGKRRFVRLRRDSGLTALAQDAL